MQNYARARARDALILGMPSRLMSPKQRDGMFTKVSLAKFIFATRIRRRRFSHYAYGCLDSDSRLVGIRDGVTYTRTSSPSSFVDNRRNVSHALRRFRCTKTMSPRANLRFRERRVGEHVTGA